MRYNNTGDENDKQCWKNKKFKEEDYQKIFGIKKNTFDKMLKLLNEAYRIEHLRGGHPPKLSVLNRLVIMLSYYRDYRTMENIAFEYGVAKSAFRKSASDAFQLWNACYNFVGVSVYV